MSDAPAALVADLDRLANRLPALLYRDGWFPLALFGLLALASVPVFDRWDPATTPSWLWWALGGPLGAYATIAWSAQRSRGLGVKPGNTLQGWLLNLLVVVGCSVTALLAEPPWTLPAVFSFVGLVNLGIGLVVWRNGFVAMLGAGLAATGITAGLGGLSPATFSAILASFLLTTALVSYTVSR